MFMAWPTLLSFEQVSSMTCDGILAAAMSAAILVYDHCHVIAGLGAVSCR